MDVIESLRTLRKLWVLTLLLLLLTLTAVGALARKPGPYEAESQVALLPSAQSSKTLGSNPYLAFGSSISIAADLVRREVMDPRTGEALATKGFTSSYAVIDDPTTPGPVLDVTVTGSSKSLVEHTLSGITAEIGTKLALMQTGIKPANRITALVVSNDPEPSLKLSQKARPLAAALGIGLVLTIAVPQFVEGGLAARRRARYERRRHSGQKENEFAAGRNHRSKAPVLHDSRSYPAQEHWPPSRPIHEDPRRRLEHLPSQGNAGRSPASGSGDGPAGIPNR